MTLFESRRSAVKMFPLLFFAFFLAHPLASAEKILVVSMLNSKSVKNFYSSLYIELANKGHDLTIISSFKTSEHPKIRDIIGTDILQDSQKNQKNKKSNFLDDKNVFTDRKQGKSGLPISLTPYLVELCRSYYSMGEIQDLVKNEKFDIILATYTLNECGFGLIHHFQAPFILLHANVIVPWNNPTGLPFPYSHVPLPYFPTSDKMDFYERLRNFVFGSAYGFADNWYRIPKMEAVYREFLPNAPSSHEIAKNVSLIFTNSHHSLNYPRPLMPDIIEVGGMHCRPGKPLPKDIEEFVNSSGHAGFIFFSLGSIVPAHTMPEETRLEIMKTFSKLEQKVLWKWETETMENLPKNVKLSKWLPQQDILASPKIRLFITHGGLHSIEEAIYHAVPVVGLPLYGDQDANMKNAEHFGFAITLDLINLTETSLTWAVTTVLNDNRFQENARRMSRIFKDRLDEPLARAVFWTEYVLRNEGADHLKSPGRNMNAFEYYCIDVVLFLLTMVALLAYIAYKVFVLLLKLRFLWNR